MLNLGLGFADLRCWVWVLIDTCSLFGFDVLGVLDFIVGLMGGGGCFLRLRWAVRQLGIRCSTFVCWVYLDVALSLCATLGFFVLGCGWVECFAADCSV